MNVRVSARRLPRTLGLAVGLTLLAPGATMETRDPDERAIAVADRDGTVVDRSDGRRRDRHDDAIRTDAP